MFVWGHGSVGQTGLGTQDKVNVPTCVQALQGQHVTQVQQPYNSPYDCDCDCDCDMTVTVAVAVATTVTAAASATADAL